MINKHTVAKNRKATEFPTRVTKIHGVLNVTSILFIGLLSFLGCGDPNLDDPIVREKFIKKAINADDLQMRRTPSGEEFPYAPNEESPYTGWVHTGWVQSNQERWWFQSDRQASTKVLAHFQHGKPHGIYISWYGNWQKSEQGSYKTGNRDGAWTMWHENGQKSNEGIYKDGQRDGIWSGWYPDGMDKYDGNYIDGLPEGLRTEWYENGQKKLEETWKNRRQDGLWTEWYENGQKIRTSSYITGSRDGLWTEWHENGQKSSEGTYSGDFRVGDWTWWYENGAKMAEGTFRDGRNMSLVYLHNQYDSLTEFDSVSSEGTWIDGIADGKWTYWFNNGNKFAEGNYNSGNGVGLWTWLYRNGLKYMEGTLRRSEYDIGATWFGVPGYRTTTYGGAFGVSMGGNWIEKKTELTACGFAVGNWKSWSNSGKLDWEVNIDKNDKGPTVYNKVINRIFLGRHSTEKRLMIKYIDRYKRDVSLNKKLE